MTCYSFVIDVYVNVWYFHNVFRFVWDFVVFRVLGGISTLLLPKWKLDCSGKRISMSSVSGLVSTFTDCSGKHIPCLVSGLVSTFTKSSLLKDSKVQQKAWKTSGPLLGNISNRTRVRPIRVGWWRINSLISWSRILFWTKKNSYLTLNDNYSLTTCIHDHGHTFICTICTYTNVSMV